MRFYVVLFLIILPKSGPVDLSPSEPEPTKKKVSGLLGSLVAPLGDLEE